MDIAEGSSIPKKRSASIKDRQILEIYIWKSRALAHARSSTGELPSLGVLIDFLNSIDPASPRGSPNYVEEEKIARAKRLENLYKFPGFMESVTDFQNMSDDEKCDEFGVYVSGQYPVDIHLPRSICKVASKGLLLRRNRALLICINALANMRNRLSLGAVRIFVKFVQIFPRDNVRTIADKCFAGFRNYQPAHDLIEPYLGPQNQSESSGSQAEEDLPVSIN